MYECVRRKHDIEMCRELAPTQPKWVPSVLICDQFFFNIIILFWYECVRRKHDIEMCREFAPTQPKVTQIMRCTTEKN